MPKTHYKRKVLSFINQISNLISEYNLRKRCRERSQ